MFNIIVHTTLALLLALTPNIALIESPGAASIANIGEDELAESEPTIKDSSQGETEDPDGRLSRWVSVTYELSTGQEAQAFVEVDEGGSSEAWLYLDGEPIVHITTDGADTTSTWVADGLDVSPDMLAELVSANVASEVFAGLATEAPDPCAWAQAAKYAWYGIIGATAAACCVGATVPSGGAACVACGGLAAVAMGAGSDIADDYC